MAIFQKITCCPSKFLVVEWLTVNESRKKGHMMEKLPSLDGLSPHPQCAWKHFYWWKAQRKFADCKQCWRSCAKLWSELKFLPCFFSKENFVAWSEWMKLFVGLVFQWIFSFQIPGLLNPEIKGFMLTSRCALTLFYFQISITPSQIA